MLSLSCCFPEAEAEAPVSPQPNLTTYTYQTEYGTVSLTWSRSMLGRSLHLQLHSAATFHLRIKPWNKKRGSKKLSHNTLFLWNLSHATFARGPHPISRFYLALLVDHSLTLLVGDQAPKPKPKPAPQAQHQPQQHLLLRRDHVHVAPHSTTVYQTATPLAGKVRDFRIDCHGHAHDDSLALVFRVDSHSVLHVTRLRWKFRGSQRLEIDGAHLHISWDVHDWLFDKDKDHLHQNAAAAHGHAVFMFKFEDHQVAPPNNNNNNKDLLVDPLTHHHWSLGSNNAKSWSSSSLSVSSGSFGGTSSVMEWSSVEENDLVVPLGFSLVVYAWRR